MTNIIELSMSDRPYEGKIPQGDRQAWADLYRSLVTVNLDAAGIADALYKGYIIGPVLDGWRSYDHFIRAQHIGIDMDEGTAQSSIAALIDHDLVQMYGAIVYSTPSSTPTAPRSRVIFLLDQAISDPYKYKAAIRTVSRYFLGYDPSSAEPTRTFFGNSSLAKSHNTDGMFIPMSSLLPLEDLRTMYAAQQVEDAKHRRPTINYTDHDLNIGKMVQSCISKAASGGRNNVCYWMACRFVENGVADSEAEQAVRHFAESVPQTPDAFTYDEAMSCLRSARTGATR